MDKNSFQRANGDLGNNPRRIDPEQVGGAIKMELDRPISLEITQTLFSGEFKFFRLQGVFCKAI